VDVAGESDRKTIRCGLERFDELLCHRNISVRNIIGGVENGPANNADRSPGPCTP
jgi:hypothetical protein